MLKYLEEIENVVDWKSANEEISKAADILKSGKRVWICGNGGSLAIAQHFALDLVKVARVKAIALNCPSSITAWGNDTGFANSFYGQFSVLREEGEPVVIFSCSGKSRNLMQFLGERVRPLIAIIGTDGGYFKPYSDVFINVKSDDYQLCETVFSIISDLILKRIKEGKQIKL